MDTVQLSHDELLLLLGFAQLPMPLALGEAPLDEYSDETLDAALTSALASLMAREFVTELPAAGAPASLLPEVESLITTSALADGCLMVAAHWDGHDQTLHYSARGERAIVHSSPRERVHRLEALAGKAAIVEHLLGVIGAPAEDATPLTFAAEAVAFGQAVELAGAGQLDAARRALCDAGVPAETAEQVADRLSSETTRFGLMAVHKLRSVHPFAESALVLCAGTEAWCVEDDSAQQGQLRVSSMDEPTLRARLAALVAGIAAGH